MVFNLRKYRSGGCVLCGQRGFCVVQAFVESVVNSSELSIRIHISGISTACLSKKNGFYKPVLGHSYEFLPGRPSALHKERALGQTPFGYVVKDLY